MSRHLDGQVPLNGSLGEIYRNFFYMPDRPSSTAAVISTFYSRYDPKVFTVALRRKDVSFGDGGHAMRQAIGTAFKSNSRAGRVEELTLKFHGRFWTGRDAADKPALRPDVLSLPGACGDEYRKDALNFRAWAIFKVARSAGSARAWPVISDYGFALDGPRRSSTPVQRPSSARSVRRSAQIMHFG